MEFRILGPLEVHAESGPVRLGGTQQRGLLAILLLHRNEIIASDRLIDALWEGEPPETAAKALQVYVSQLRKLLGRERLQTMPPGYLLRLAPDELDLERFERLQQQGSLREALSLWRGPPLADFAYRRFAQAETARLEELRRHCLEERIEQDLARRAPRRAGRRAGSAGLRASAARASPGSADAQPLPLRPSGGGARGLPGGTQRPRRGARHRARAPVARPPPGHPPAGPGTRPAR